MGAVGYPEALWSRASQSRKALVRAYLQPGTGAYLTIHNGLLLLHLHFLLSSLSTQQSLKDWPFWEATLLLQGCITIWGQSTGKVVSAEEVVVKVPGCREVGVAGTGSPTLSQQWA